MNMRIKLWPQEIPLYLPISILFLQTAIPLLIRHTRHPNTSESSLYHPASITLWAELFKCLVAFGYLYSAIRGDLFETTRLEALSATVRRFRGAVWRRR